MDEADVVAGRALANSTRGEAHALGGEPIDRRLQIVDPEPDVIERRIVHLGALLGIDRLHEVDLDLERSRAGRGDVLVDVFRFAAKVSGHGEPERVDPEPAQRALVEPADGDLLHTQNRKWSMAHV